MTFLRIKERNPLAMQRRLWKKLMLKTQRKKRRQRKLIKSKTIK
jgi:hypothetical protein